MPDGSYWLTRFVFLRMLGLVYAVAFLVIVNQWMPLLGSHGLLPAAPFLDRRRRGLGAGFTTFLRLPTLFWLDASPTRRFRRCGLLGLGLSLVVLFGFANVPDPGGSLAPLHVLRPRRARSSTATAGRRCSSRRASSRSSSLPSGACDPFPRRTPPPTVVIVLLRWLIFRMMLGAGLIKLRGDSVLARPHVPRLPLRDAAEPEPALVVLPSAPALVSPDRGALQPRRGAASRRSSSSARGGRVTWPAGSDRPLPGPAHRERQPVVPELAHDHGRRSPASTTASWAAWFPRRTARRGSSSERRTPGRRRSAESPSTPWPSWWRS